MVKFVLMNWNLANFESIKLTVRLKWLPIIGSILMWDGQLLNFAIFRFRSIISKFKFVNPYQAGRFGMSLLSQCCQLKEKVYSSPPLSSSCPPPPKKKNCKIVSWTANFSLWVWVHIFSIFLLFHLSDYHNLNPLLTYYQNLNPYT